MDAADRNTGYTQRTLGSARHLRRVATPMERELWRRIRSRKIGEFKWRRQQPVGPYIVDFYCAELNLVFELDGDAHMYKTEQDRIRQAFLEEQGFRVLRYTNAQVRENMDGVLEVVWRICLEIAGRKPEDL